MKGHGAAQGFTLLELLIAMSIFGVVLLLAGNLFSSANAYTTLTVTASEVEDDVRLSLLRITEITSQAAYIYPAGITLTLNTGTVTTGKNALALLAPAGSPYCPGDVTANSDKYCLFVYRLRPRSAYTAVLPRLKNPTPDVLVEQRARWVTWTLNTVPGLNFSSLSLTDGVVVDSIDANLTDFGRLTVGTNAGLDTVLGVGSSVLPTQANAQIQVVQPMIAAQVSTFKAQRSGFVFVRSIPRVAPPGTGFTMGAN